MLLRKLQMIFFRNSFNDLVLTTCSDFISALLEIHDPTYRDFQQQDANVLYFDWIRDQGLDEIRDFRQALMEDITKVTESENPTKCMRKQLILTIHLMSLNRLFIESERRQELFGVFNNNKKYSFSSNDYSNTDETAIRLYMWCCARNHILRLLQNSLFEKTTDNDWFAKYDKTYNALMTELFDTILNKIDKKEVPDLDELFPPMMEKALLIQKEMIGDVID